MDQGVDAGTAEANRSARRMSDLIIEQASRLAQIAMDRCDELALQTEEPGRVTRRFLTPPMRTVHHMIGDWMRAAGMVVRIDDAGNLVGRRLACRGDRPEAASSNPQVLVIGSHLDTVPNAGKYDGILGVLIGLAVVEALGDVELPFAIDVIGFSEEEGVRFATPYIGSRAVAGRFDESLLDRQDELGISMRTAIHEFDLNPAGISACAYEPNSVIGFVEPHIEQGSVLERAAMPVGVVDSIVGQSRLVLRFIGTAGHAGTTPMMPRRDALCGAAKWITEVERVGRETAGLRATVGRLVLSPNASNVIPSEVEMSLDVRHDSDEVRLGAVQWLVDFGHQLASDENLEFQVCQRGDSDSVVMAPRLTSLLSDAITAKGLSPLNLSSGAGHDAVVMAAAFPVAMLFIRHPGGISHHPSETVDVDDVSVAIEVMFNFTIRNHQTPGATA